MELMHGSPADMTGRSDRERRVYEFLDSLAVPFDRTDHPERPATTMEVCAEVDAVLGVRICKNLFLCNRNRSRYYLLVMPGDKPFKTKELSAQIGSVSVLGLMNDRDRSVQLVIDEDVLAEALFGCHPCENTSSIRFATKDLTGKILPALGYTPAVVRLYGTDQP